MKRLILAFVITAIAVLGYTSIPSVPECVKANAWATAHASDLPDTIEELSPLPVSYRRAAFVLLTAEQKFNVLQGQREYILSENLTERQREIVNELFDYVTVERLQSKTDFPTGIVQTIKREFTRDQAKRYFLTIGPSTVNVVNAAQGSPECNCSTSDDWCEDQVGGMKYDCVSMLACSTDGWGCGTLWTQACDGSCVGTPLPGGGAPLQ